MSDDLPHLFVFQALIERNGPSEIDKIHMLICPLEMPRWCYGLL